VSHCIISGSGVFTPPHSISNQELVTSYNQYVDKFNQENVEKINQGMICPLDYSSVDFIEKASGIKNRYVIEKRGILDIDIMHPVIEDRQDEQLSLQAEMAVSAAVDALKAANKKAADIDAVICACSNMQRPYPAMAIEIQHALGITGYAFDMNVACSSATFAISTASGLIKSGGARAVLIVNPEICSAHLDFRDRDSHFIFGDVATAIVIERDDTHCTDSYFEILNSKLVTSFSSNVRNNAGFMNRITTRSENKNDKLFYQDGRKVFKEVTLDVVKLISTQLSAFKMPAQHLKRLWLHQANIHMNQLIIEKLLGKEIDDDVAPIILDEYANTAGAGSIIALNHHQKGLDDGSLGLLCSFGAGYSIGSHLLRYRCAS
jgi:beta-ketodecanoyl-[acyl-carrier-protein] synthase